MSQAYLSSEVSSTLCVRGQEDVRGVNMGGNGGNIFLLATSTVRPFKQEGRWPFLLNTRIVKLSETNMSKKARQA